MILKENSLQRHRRGHILGMVRLALAPLRRLRVVRATLTMTGGNGLCSTETLGQLGGGGILGIRARARRSNEVMLSMMLAKQQQPSNSRQTRIRFVNPME